MQIDFIDTPAAESEARDREAYRALLGDSARAVRQILRVAAGVDQPDPSGHEALARAAGRRDVGIYLIERLRLHDPDGWIQFETEYLRERHQAAVHAAREEAQRKEAVPA